MTRHATVNVGRGASSAQRSAFALVLALVGLRGTVGWQEIGAADGPVDEPARLRGVFGRRLWRTAGIGTKSPITWPRAIWRCLGVERIKAVDGVKNTFPALYIVVARLARRTNGRRLTRINTHLAPGAFNGRRDPKEQERRRAWDEHWALLCVIVQREANAGADIVLSLDANRQHPPLPIRQLHSRAVLVAKSGPDYLIAVPSPGRRVIADRRGDRALGIDFHHALSARIRFPKETSR